MLEIKKIEQITKSIAKLLDKEEKLWMESQKHLKEEKIKNDLEKANQHTEYVHVLLEKCKKSSRTLKSKMKKNRNKFCEKKYCIGSTLQSKMCK